MALIIGLFFPLGFPQMALNTMSLNQGFCDQGASPIFIVDELKKFAANNPFQVGVLVTYWDLCIIG